MLVKDDKNNSTRTMDFSLQVKWMDSIISAHYQQMLVYAMYELIRSCSKIDMHSFSSPWGFAAD